jgi:hypothetical protein
MSAVQQCLMSKLGDLNRPFEIYRGDAFRFLLRYDLLCGDLEPRPLYQLHEELKLICHTHTHTHTQTHTHKHTHTHTHKHTHKHTHTHTHVCSVPFTGNLKPGIELCFLMNVRLLDASGETSGITKSVICRFRWPRGLMCGSAASCRWDCGFEFACYVFCLYGILRLIN